MEKLDMDSIINDYSNMLQTLMSNSRLTFDDSLHGSLPQEGGVYRIFEKEVTRSSVYVGKTGNLRARVYQDHFMGNRESSILKKRLIATGRFANENAVKEYLHSNCLVQFIVVTDEKVRTFFEHFSH
jgi:hypothetical protein